MEKPMITINYNIVKVLLLVALLSFPAFSYAADDDGDGFDSAIDNCPEIVNTDQADLDQDNVGDDCDTDRDGDGLTNAYEEVVLETDPDMWDTDEDDFSDFYDCDPLDPDTTVGEDCVTGAISVRFNTEQSPDPLADDDEDGIVNSSDNCPFVFNPGQQDLDDDGVGDHCDPETTVSTVDTSLEGTLGGGGASPGCNLTRSASSTPAVVIFLLFLPLLFLALRSRSY
jgi:hypothetical protein